MDSLVVSKWVTFTVFVYILIQNEYQIWKGKRKADSREQKLFRYSMWAAVVGFLIIALMGNLE